MEAIAPEQTLASRYVLRRPIGGGRLTTVWKAEDPTLARIVAVKILRDEWCRDPSVREAFLAQARSAARLVHPDIAPLYDVGAKEGRAFIVLEYVPGGTLRESLSGGGLLDTETAIDVVRRVLSALCFAHEAGLVHGDLTPENVLLGAEGHVKVGDFGLAEAVRGAVRSSTVAHAQPPDLGPSPEQRRGAAATRVSDVYAAGAMLGELLTGRTEPAAPSAIRPGVPRELDRVVDRATQAEPAERYASADAMRGALERLGGRTQSPAPAVVSRVGEPAGGRRAFFRSWMLVPVLVLVLGAAAIAAGIAFGRLEVGGPLGIRAAGPRSPAAVSSTSRPLTVVAVHDIDPVADGGDGSEHPELTPLVIDGSDATSWTTDHYASAEFGNLKPGVGLWLQLAGPATVRQVTVTTGLPGWTFELIGGTRADPTGRPLPSLDGRTSFVASPGGTTVKLQPARMAGILLWITRLAPDGGRFAATVAEVSLAGTPG